MSKSILIAGATGLVGGECMKRLLADPAFGRVTVLARHPLPAEIKYMDEGGKIDEHLIDFDALSKERLGAIFEVDQILCCLGTTMKKAGSKQQFREIDFGYPRKLAEIGRSHGVRHYLLVSAIGADTGSRFFYNRVKGEVEQAVLGYGFPAVTIVRPSLLLGDRDEFRLGEEIAGRLRFLFPPKYRPVHAADVARVLVDAAREDLPGHHIIESAEIHSRAGQQ